MSCPGYHPPIRFQLTGSKLSGSNCGPSALCCALDDDSCGAVSLAPDYARSLFRNPDGTRDVTGGTNLGQARDVARLFGVTLDVRYRMPWADVERHIDGGGGAMLAAGYRPIRDSRFKAANTTVNHMLYIPSSWAVRDSLADGRRADVYRFRDEPYPRALLRQAAGELLMDAASGRRIGVGYAYVGLVRDHEPEYRVVIRPLSPGGRRSFWTYQLRDGVIVGRVAKSTGGFSADCMPPATFRWPAKRKSYSLVRITSGFLAGTYVGVTWMEERP